MKRIVGDLFVVDDSSETKQGRYVFNTKRNILIGLLLAASIIVVGVFLVRVVGKWILQLLLR